MRRPCTAKPTDSLLPSGRSTSGLPSAYGANVSGSAADRSRQPVGAEDGAGEADPVGVGVTAGADGEAGDESRGEGEGEGMTEVVREPPFGARLVSIRAHDPSGRR